MTALTCLLGSGQLLAQGELIARDQRSMFGDTAAKAIEEAMAVVFPGSALEWADRVRLRQPGRDPQEVLFPGFLQRPESDGFLFVTALDFPGESARLVGAARRGEGIRAAEPMTRILAFRTDRTGRLRGMPITGGLDSENPASEALNVRIAGAVSSGQWPLLDVRYRSLHAGSGWYGFVDWVAEYDMNSGAPLRKRSPVMLRRIEKAGGERILAFTQDGSSPEKARVAVGNTADVGECGPECRASGGDELLAKMGR